MESIPEVRGRAGGVIMEAPEGNTSSEPERKYQHQIIQESLLAPTGGAVGANNTVQFQTRTGPAGLTQV